MHDFKEGIERAHVVLHPNAWAPSILFRPPIDQGNKDEAVSIIARFRDWKCTEKIMGLVDPNAIHMHCLSADRGFEVSNSVMDKTDGHGWTSAIFNQAENRFHVQKAVLNLVL